MEKPEAIFKDELLDEELIAIKGRFFKNIFNQKFLHDSYKYCFDKSGFNKKSLELIKHDPVFQQIKKLYNGEIENAHVVKGSLQNQGEEGEDLNYKDQQNYSNIVISMNPPEDNEEVKEEDSFNYSETMDTILIEKFSEFGMFKDFEILMKSANMFYETNDEISNFVRLLLKNKKLEQIILSKKEEYFVKRFNLEAKIIADIDNEMDSKTEQFKSIIIEDNHQTSIEYLDEKLKIFFMKEFEFKNLLKLIQLIYEVDHYNYWVPSIQQVNTLKYIAKSKKCFYAKFNLPIIQERDMILYQFVNNKLKESLSLQFLCKSFDEEEALKHENTIIRDMDIIRIDLLNSKLELHIRDDSKIILEGFINVDMRLKFIPENLMEILTRQYMKKLFYNIDNVLNLDEKEFNRKIPRNLIKTQSSGFYHFYEEELKKYFNFSTADETVRLII